MALAKHKDLMPWVKTICIHLWWSCSSCGGDGGVQVNAPSDLLGPSLVRGRSGTPLLPWIANRGPAEEEEVATGRFTNLQSTVLSGHGQTPAEGS